MENDSASDVAIEMAKFHFCALFLCKIKADSCSSDSQRVSSEELLAEVSEESVTRQTISVKRGKGPPPKGPQTTLRAQNTRTHTQSELRCGLTFPLAQRCSADLPIGFGSS